MKRVPFCLIAMLAALGLQSCGELGGLNGSKDPWANLVNETKHEALVNGNTLTYGSHTYTVMGEIDLEDTNHKVPTASVSFTNIPSGYTEFEAVYEGLLGKSLQGTAAMIPMAIEI